MKVIDDFFKIIFMVFVSQYIDISIKTYKMYV